ncbi:MAG TPA: hypothetical protein VFV35_03290 [Acidimicrobiales bacterium]|nr:hypothetical protein [Acidimicrobiales bacterium]
MTRVRRGDDGAYLVLYSLLAVGLFAAVALVLDIAALRQGRRSDRAAADFAAAAGASTLDPVAPSSYAEACEAAWDYVVLNRDAAGGAVSPPDCLGTFPPVACDPLVPATATGTLGPLTVSITYPVPDGDDLLRAEVAGGDVTQTTDAARDGEPCQRVAVRVQRERDFLFRGLTSADSGRTDVHAVARRVVQSGPDVPAAVALDPTGCPAVAASFGELEVLPAAPGAPGKLVVDSDLSGCGGFALEAPFLGGAAIRAGEIEAFALTGPHAARVRSGDVTPAPVGVTTRLGRSFLDARYDCGPACGEPAGELDALRAQFGAGTPAGLVVDASMCAVPFATSVVHAVDTYIDCPGGLRVDGALTLLGASTVTAGDVHIGPTGCLAVNDGACGAPVGSVRTEAVLYVRGDLSKEDLGDVALTNTFLYAGGTVTVPRGALLGTSSFRATAPLTGPFEDLLLWTETVGDATLGEQQSFLLEGTVAAPNATVVLATRPLGGATVAAQVVASRIRLEGTGSYRLSPSAARATGAVARQAKLIR